jgi:hypothetical protein
VKVRFIFHRINQHESVSAWDVDSPPRCGDLVSFGSQSYRVEDVHWKLGAGRDDVQVDVDLREAKG